MDFDHLFPKDLYHSYVIEGNGEKVAYLLFDYLEKRGEINKQSPDVMISIHDSFNISDSESIKVWHKNKPIDGKKKICIIGTKFINREAEQSLLKIIEEPNANTHFFIIIPDSSLLLNTIISRVHLIKNNFSNTDEILANDFIKMNPKSRIEKVGEFINEFKDEDNSGSLRNKAISLINGLEVKFYKDWKKDVDNEKLKFILNELKNSRNFLKIPGASVKMILEHIALVI